MSEVIDVIISETCGAVLACDPDEAPSKVVSYTRFRQLERSVEAQAITPPLPDDVAAKRAAYQPISYKPDNDESYDEDDLIEWLARQGFTIHFYWRVKGLIEIREIKPGRLGSQQRWIEVSFITVKHFPLALALAAVRLLEEKQ